MKMKDTDLCPSAFPLYCISPCILKTTTAYFYSPEEAAFTREKLFQVAQKLRLLVVGNLFILLYL